MLNHKVLNDYLTLCKPKVVLLMLLTAWVGMYLANPTFINWQAWIFGSLGIAFAAGAAAVINHLMDRHIDLQMSRTATRPIACGRISTQQAIYFALILTLFAAVILCCMVNLLTGVLSFATLIGYAIIYTMYLKRATPQNIVIGGLSGAMPPLLGWTAITGEVSANSLLLVLIIFTWTPPHFWALAIYRVNDYATAKIPMLPVTHGIVFTKLCLLLYTILLFAVTTLPFVVGMASLFYLSLSIILNVIFLGFAIHLYMASGKNEHRIAIKTFNFSIVYLLLIFIGLLLDRYYGA